MRPFLPEMIPQTIHYVWLGGRPLDEMGVQCIQSWETHLPGWRIKKWDERNSPISHPFVANMMKKGLFAFASDYIRIHALSKEGGLYLDTDVEIIRPADSILKYDGLTVGLLSLQNRLKKCSIGTSWISAPKECVWIEKLKGRYQGLKKAVMNNTIFTQELLPAFVGHEIPNHGDFDYFEASGARIYHPDFLNPVEQGPDGKNTPAGKKRSIAIHHAKGNWGGREDPPSIWRKILDMRVDRKIIRPVEKLIRKARS